VGADSEQTRAAILAAARAVIAESGYAAATFQQIALRAGVSRPTLHYYFGTLDRVYDVLMEQAYSTLAACIADARSRSTPREQLATFLSSVHRLCVEDPAAMRFLVAARLERSRHPAGHGAAQTLVAAVDEFYDAVVADAAHRGDLAAGADVRAVAHMLAALFWGMGFHAAFVTHHVEASAVARQWEKVLDSGLLTRPLAAQTEG
jgi:AcrR family transcriptional regulator